MKKKPSLNHIIFAAITIVAVVSLLSFWLICNQRVSDMITERALDDYEQTTVAVQKNVETLISYTEDFSKYLALDESIQKLIQEQAQASETGYVRNEMEIYREWDQISRTLIYSTSRLAGMAVYSNDERLYGHPVAYDTDIIPIADLERAKENKTPQWTALLQLKSYGWYEREEPVYAVLKYVQSDRGERIGTIALFVRESSFADILANTDDAEKRQFYLVDEDNKIISSLEKDNLNKNSAEILGLTLDEYEACLDNEQFLLEPIGGVPILYTAKTLEGTPFRLVGCTALEELQEQRKELALFMQVTLLLALVAAVFVSWVVSKQVTKPLNQIIGVMKEIEGSTTNEMLRCPVGRIEEIDQLGCEFNRLMDKVDEAAEQIYQEQRQRRHNEIRLLQAQIVPHFLYNTLGMISALIRLDHRQEAQDAIHNLSTFYRLSLSRGNEYITVREEMELTRSYLALQKMRYIEYVDYTMVCDERVEEYIIPKLLLQPLVENVLTHGLNPDGQKCTIIIETKYDPECDCCVLSVSDNGRGISKERLAEIRGSLKNETSLTKSFGLLNLNQRMKLLYGEDFSLSVDSKEGSYTVFTLTIRGEADGHQKRD